jgi:lipoate-protein ligase B
MAASDTAGSATIRLFEDPAKNTLAGNLVDSLRANPCGLENIEMCRLDSVVGQFKVDSIDLLKSMWRVLRQMFSVAAVST